MKLPSFEIVKLLARAIARVSDKNNVKEVEDIVSPISTGHHLVSSRLISCFLVSELVNRC